MTADNTIGQGEQTRDAILLTINNCAEEATREEKRTDLMSIATHSFFNTDETFTVAEGLKGHSREEVQNAIDSYRKEILESKGKVERIVLPTKDEGYRTIEIQELKAEKNNFFFGEEIIRNKRGEKINHAYYVRGVKTSLGQKLKKLVHPTIKK